MHMHTHSPGTLLFIKQYLCKPKHKPMALLDVCMTVDMVTRNLGMGKYQYQYQYQAYTCLISKYRVLLKVPFSSTYVLMILKAAIQPANKVPKLLKKDTGFAFFVLYLDLVGEPITVKLRHIIGK